MNPSFRVNGIATTLRRSCYLSASIALAAYSLPSAFAQQWIEDSSDIPYLMEKAADGSAYQVRFLSTLVRWVSLDDEQPKSFTLFGQSLEDSPPPLYSQEFDEYAFFINFMGDAIDSDEAPLNDTLGTNDSALISKLIGALPEINAEIAANTAAQQASPPAPPIQGARKFYRIRRFFTDTDQDGLQDHLEAQNGTDKWNWDSDGDGISDSLDLNPLVNDAVADPDGAGLDDSLANGLIGRWDLEEGNGNVLVDSSGNNWSGQIHTTSSSNQLERNPLRKKPARASITGT